MIGRKKMCVANLFIKFCMSTLIVLCLDRLNNKLIENVSYIKRQKKRKIMIATYIIAFSTQCCRIAFTL